MHILTFVERSPPQIQGQKLIFSGLPIDRSAMPSHRPAACSSDSSDIPSSSASTAAPGSSSTSTIGEVPVIDLKAVADSIITRLGAGDAYARKVSKWRSEAVAVDHLSRIGRPPTVDFVKDVVVLRKRKEAHAEIFDAWDSRDKARKTAGKRAANAETNMARGKQPSGASNRRSRALGETGPLARIIAKVKAAAPCGSGCSLQGRFKEEQRLLGDNYLWTGQQVAISSLAVKGGLATGTLVEPAQLCSEDQRGRLDPKSVVPRDASGALRVSEPRHCHLVQLHASGDMVRFPPAHVVPWPRNGARVGYFSGRSPSETGRVVRFSAYGKVDTDALEPSFYHVARSFYVRRPHVRHMVHNLIRIGKPLRVGDWVWVDVSRLDSSIDMGSFECPDLDAGDEHAFTSDRIIEGSLLGDAFTSPDRVRRLLDLRSSDVRPPSFNSEVITLASVRRKAREASEAEAKLSAASTALEHALAEQVTATAIYDALNAPKPIYQDNNRAMVTKYFESLPQLSSLEKDWSLASHEYHKYRDREDRDTEKEARLGDNHRLYMIDPTYHKQVTKYALIGKGTGDLFDAMWATINRAEQAEHSLHSLRRHAESSRACANIWEGGLRCQEKLKTCLPLLSVCIIKAICSTCKDCFEIEETFVAADSQFDIFDDGYVPPSRPTHSCRCSHIGPDAQGVESASDDDEDQKSALVSAIISRVHTSQ